MTVCGFARSRDGSGLCWADSEAYSHGSPLREPAEKLIVSPGSNLVGFGVGYIVLLEEFHRLVASLGKEPFAIAASRLPTQLRKARDEWRAQILGRGADYDERSAFALCGFGAIGFRGFVFAEATAFEPVERSSWSSPNVDRSVSSASDVLEFAQAQIRYVQVKSPTATGRELTIAKLLGPGKVERVSVPLLLDYERPLSLGDSMAHAPRQAQTADRDPPTAVEAERARLVEIARKRECFS